MRRYVDEILQGLLRTKLFKIVIATTFDSYLEILMRDIWDSRLRVVNVWDAALPSSFYDPLAEYKEVKDANN